MAALIRSVTPHSQQTPHTGALRYQPDVPRIPSAALTVEDAELLHRMQNRGQPVDVTLKMQAHTLPDAPSRNVVAELRGSERPDEVVVLGGHIDSWDVGEGAMDDGGGAFAAWEAVRLIKALGLRPRRTLRVVMWVNEENGGRGGRAYHDQHLAELPRTVAAMESDNGVFRPNGFRFQGTPEGLAVARQIGALLDGIGAGSVIAGDGEADVGPTIRTGVPGFALNVDDSTYFWYHHTDADMMTMINPDDFRRCIATMAVMAYVLADMPAALPRAAGQWNPNLTSLPEFPKPPMRTFDPLRRPPRRCDLGAGERPAVRARRRHRPAARILRHPLCRQRARGAPHRGRAQRRRVRRRAGRPARPSTGHHRPARHRPRRRGRRPERLG